MMAAPNFRPDMDQLKTSAAFYNPVAAGHTARMFRFHLSVEKVSDHPGPRRKLTLHTPQPNPFGSYHDSKTASALHPTLNEDRVFSLSKKRQHLRLVGCAK